MKKTILFGFVMALLVACNPAPKSDKATEGTPLKDSLSIVDGSTAKTSLDYYGIYEGVTPCADCEGIKVNLTINKDGSYLLKKVYQKNGKEINPSEEKGKFVWNDAGNTITLEGVKDAPASFKVNEGKLEMLGADGKPVESSLKDQYMLKQLQAF